MPQIETAWVIQGAAEGEPHFLVIDDKGSYWSQDQSKAKRFASSEYALVVGRKYLTDSEFNCIFTAFPIAPSSGAREGGAAGGTTTINVSGGATIGPELAAAIGKAAL